MKTTIIIYSALYEQSVILGTHTIAAATVKSIYRFNRNVVVRVFYISCIINYRIFLVFFSYYKVFLVFVIEHTIYEAITIHLKKITIPITPITSGLHLQINKVDSCVVVLIFLCVSVCLSSFFVLLFYCDFKSSMYAFYFSKRSLFYSHWHRLRSMSNTSIVFIRRSLTISYRKHRSPHPQS